MMTHAGEVYDLAARLIRRARAAGRDDVARRLDDALHAGSSAMEILGSIGAVLVDEAETLGAFAPPSQLQVAVRFVASVLGKE